MDKRDRVEKEKVLAQYVVDSLNTHNFWAFKVGFIGETIRLGNLVVRFHIIMKLLIFFMQFKSVSTFLV